MAVAALLLLAGTASALKSQAYIPHLSDDFTVSRLQTSQNTAPLTELTVTENVVELTRVNSLSLSAVYVQALRRQAQGIRATASAMKGLERNGSVNLVPAEVGQVFLAPVTVGGQNFDVVVDSGSSDPWIVTPDFTCFDFLGDKLDQDQCHFGAPWNRSLSTTFNTLLPSENFNISYADGESLTGAIGYESFTMGGITVPRQEFGAVNVAAWSGDGVSSGLIGFAYRTLTSAYAGSDPNADKGGTALMYNPLFVNMYTNQGVPPVFSLAIYRDPSAGGVLALGGIPNIPHSAAFTSTPIIPVGVNISSGQTVYEFYTIATDGWAYSSQGVNAQYDIAGTGNKKKVPLVQGVDANNRVLNTAIVDSGTSLVYVANNIAAGINALFNPPATYDASGTYYVDCDATAPPWGVVIANKTFFANPADMMLRISETDCISGVQPNFGGLTILGDVWMKSVLCVFDLGAEMMRFSAREFSGLTVTSKQPNT